MAESQPTPSFHPLAPSGTPLPLTLEAPPPSLPFTDAQVDEYREQDRWLPIANVARIMKNSLPPTAKVSKDAKECVQECVSEFISFITSEAGEKCLNEKRKTINGEDILTSMRSLGFDNYEGVLKIYLAQYREHQNAQSKQKSTGDDTKDDLVDGKRGPAEDDDAEGRKRKRKSSGKRRPADEA